jgi:glycerol uptake facilitator-like aquaporin
MPNSASATGSLARRATAEAVGTALLLAAVVGSDIMAQRLAGGNVAIALLANTIATGGALAAIVLAFGPISGAHFNPAVTIVDAWQHGIGWRDVPAYIGAQIVGALGRRQRESHVWAADLLRVASRPDWQWAVAGRVHRDVRPAGRHLGLFRSKSPFTPFAVAAYIVGAYWFTSSTSFANPAVTIARSLSDTFAGIRPIDAPFFIVAQLLGAVAATALFACLMPFSKTIAPAVVAQPEVPCSQRHPFSRTSVMRPSTT